MTDSLSASDAPESAPKLSLTPEQIRLLQAECDRVGPLSDRLSELATKGRAALRKVGPPSSPEQDKDGLYYPLLFLVEAVESYQRWFNEEGSESAPPTETEPQTCQRCGHAYVEHPVEPGKSGETWWHPCTHGDGTTAECSCGNFMAATNK